MPLWQLVHGPEQIDQDAHGQLLALLFILVRCTYQTLYFYVSAFVSDLLGDGWCTAEVTLS